MKIGLIDHYLDEWHAQNYPRMFREEIASQGLNMEIALAYGFCDKEDGMSNADWSIKNAVPLARSAEELSEICDGVMVMAPSFPEKHFDYARPALSLGKPVYIDKIFAPSEADGKAIFDFAAAHNAPMFSSSALRFDKTMDDYRTGKVKNVQWCSTGGPYEFAVYAIHQMEMIETVMGRPNRVKAIGNVFGRTLVFDYGAGRYAEMVQTRATPFQVAAAGEGFTRHALCTNDFFMNLVRAILKFFQTGEPPIQPQNTLNALAMLTAGTTAMTKQDTWIDL